MFRFLNRYLISWTPWYFCYILTLRRAVVSTSQQEGQGQRSLAEKAGSEAAHIQDPAPPLVDAADDDSGSDSGSGSMVEHPDGQVQCRVCVRLCFEFRSGAPCMRCDLLRSALQIADMLVRSMLYYLPLPATIF